MIIEISNAAQQDLLDGYHFYEAQTEGLGTYFLDSLTSDIDSLVIYAGIHALHFGNFHRLLGKRFPFAVYYRVEDSIIRIYAVLDCRLNPVWLRNQLVNAEADIVSRPSAPEE
ncbi:type II toxin-antitoxin system RelE/ParE family toxin [Acidithiobacillus sp.]|uniref:type II toxin-antitoxin system RelE/ParE family toxin n=1 Tax=Acidithiobacillus sp. TaxID=1872118 RepID=UPI0025C12E92|nr:type II toxin-antitoxin system RelE/ParE family toxin [Acidithiobacillus sp.]